METNPNAESPEIYRIGISSYINMKHDYNRHLDV